MLNTKIEAALNKQLNEELYSAYLYLSMSAFFESRNLRGCAHWMRAQFGEEQKHAQKLYHYIFERGGRVVLDAIAKPETEWKNALDTFEAALKHEQHITSSIHNLLEAAQAEKDHATQVFLNWFVSEQVEEEASTLEVVEKLKMVGDNAGGLYIIDRELAARA